ncbi:olfactory receptor 5P68-like [Rhinophrynus dorsalis]
MEEFNKTTVKEFILLAFANFQQFQILLFTVLLLMYMICILGNITIIGLIRVEPSLHSPMYFFISTFATLDILFVSATVPKLLANLIIAAKKISFVGCFAQLCAVGTMGVTECYLLAVMAFDRDLAINSPLHYSTIMRKQFCIGLAVFPWVVGFVIALLPTVFTANLEFCGPNEINHFFCDLAPLQNLACSNPFISKVVTSSAVCFATIMPFTAIIGLYIHIIITILNIKSDEGKQKAFSTCSSHLIVASMFFSTSFIVYVRPKVSPHEKFLSLFYTVITPLMNPFIYTFRNKDVKVIFKKSLRQFLKKTTS